MKCSAGSGLNHRAICKRIAVGDSELNHVSSAPLKGEQNLARGRQIRITSHQKGHQCHAAFLLQLFKTLMDGVHVPADVEATR